MKTMLLLCFPIIAIFSQPCKVSNLEYEGLDSELFKYFTLYQFYDSTGTIVCFISPKLPEAAVDGKILTPGTRYSIMYYEFQSPVCLEVSKLLNRIGRNIAVARKDGTLEFFTSDYQVKAKTYFSPNLYNQYYIQPLE